MELQRNKPSKLYESFREWTSSQKY
jgi:hypothetical protein